MQVKDEDYYRKLITSEYRLAPKFNETVRRMVRYGVKLDSSVLDIVDKFDIETAAGGQLDILGRCVGVTRELSFEPSQLVYGIICPNASEMYLDSAEESIYTVYQTPVPSKFADIQEVKGKPAADLEDDALVTDDVFRIMIKARIIQNIWKGNVLDLYEMWDNLFPDSQGLQIQDLQDMSFNIVLLGDYSVLMQELIMHGYIIPKPEGVRINTLSFISTDGLPIFAYDYNNINYSGYTSHWLQTSETDTSSVSV